MTKLMRKEI